MRANTAGNVGAVTKQTKPAPSRDEITLAELQQILIRRRKPLLACILLGVLTGLAFSILLPKRYEATGLLSINFEPSQASGVEALAQAVGVSDPTKLQTQISIMQTDSIAWEVIKRLRLDQERDALPRELLIGSPVCMTPKGMSVDSVGVLCRDRLLEEFRERLHVQAVPRTEIIEIRFRSRSPQLAAQVVETIGNVYVEDTFDSNYRAANRSHLWLSGQLDDLKRESQQAQQKLIAFQKRSGLIVSDGGQSLQLAQLNALDQQMLVARSERIVQQARYQTSLTGDPEAMVGIQQGSTLQALHAEEISLANQYAQLQSKFGDDYPRVQQMRELVAKAHELTALELKHTQQKLKTEADASIRAEDMIRSVFEGQKQEVFDSSDASVQLAMLRRDVEATNELYGQLSKRMRLSGATAGITGLDIRVIDPPQTPVAKVEPHPALNLTGGLLIGVLCGLALCGVLEAADSRLSTVRAVAQMAPIAGVGIVPTREPYIGRVHLSEYLGHTDMIDARSSETVSAYQAIRTFLAHGLASGGPKVVLVTSARTAEGKSSAAVNVALSLSLLDRRVLLVDADLEGNGFSRFVEDTGGPGLSGMLKGAIDADTYLTTKNMPGLSVVMAGSSRSPGVDLLDSPRMHHLLRVWREQFDHVIVEAREILDTSDAVVLATAADAVLLTVRVGHGRQRDLNRCEDVLVSVGKHITGAVVTENRFSTADRPAKQGPSREAESRNVPYGPGSEHGNASV